MFNYLKILSSGSVSHFWFCIKREQSLVRNLMAREEFWLLSNNTTLLVWPKKSHWKMFTAFSLKDKKYHGDSGNGWKIPKRDGNLAKGNGHFLLFLFTSYVKTGQSVQRTHHPAKCPLGPLRVVLPWRTQQLPAPHPRDRPGTEAAAELRDVRSCTG